MEVVIFMMPAFAASLILTGIHCYLGIHVVSRGIIFIDLAIAQIAALGYAIALVMSFHLDDWQSYVMALGFAALGSFAFAFARPLEKRIPLEAVIGLGYIVAAAAAVIILSYSSSGTEDFEKLTMGNILLVSWPTLVKTLLIYSAIGLFHWIFRKHFLKATFSKDQARSKLWDFLFFLSLGIVVTSSVAIGGVILVFSYLVIPAIIVLIYCNTIKSRLICGWIIGVLVSIVGLVLSFKLDFPTASTITTCFGLLFIISAIVGGKIGRYNK